MDVKEINMEKFVDVGGILEKRRREMGFTQEAIAAKIKVSIDVISAVESGKIDDIVNTVYYEGIIKAYANLIGIKEDKLLIHIGDEIKKLTNLHAEKIFSLRYKNDTQNKNLSLKFFYIIAGMAFIITIANTLIKSKNNATIKFEEYDSFGK